MGEFFEHEEDHHRLWSRLSSVVRSSHYTMLHLQQGRSRYHKLTVRDGDVRSYVPCLSGCNHTMATSQDALRASSNLNM